MEFDPVRRSIDFEASLTRSAAAVEAARRRNTAARRRRRHGATSCLRDHGAKNYLRGLRTRRSPAVAHWK